METPSRTRPSKIVGLLLFFLAPGILCLVFYFFVIRKPLTEGDKPIFISLPHYGPSQLAANGKDTLYHRIKPWKMVNQEGAVFGSEDLKGKVYVADFIFTRCQTICPKMTANLYRVQERTNHLKGVRFVSFTVDPDYDTPEVLKAYARNVHAQAKKWVFLTGNKDSLYQLAKNSFLLNALQSSTDPNDFAHSETLVLIDPNGCIRGLYDGTTIKDVDRLIQELVVLDAEVAYERNHRKRIGKG